jgi:hypothetical protein
LSPGYCYLISFIVKSFFNICTPEIAQEFDIVFFGLFFGHQVALEPTSLYNIA